MSQSDPSITPQDASSPDLLRALLERLGVSARASLLRAFEETSNLADDFDESELQEVSFSAAREQMRIDLMNELSRLTTQQAFLFTRWTEGATIKEIASELGVSVSTVSRQLKIVQKNVLYGLRKQQDHKLGTKVPAQASRLEVLTELQGRLCLTSAQAADWQDAVREARR